MHRPPIAHLGPFDAEGVGLAVDALGAGALLVDGLEKGTVAIESDAHLSAFLPVEVFDTTPALGKLLVVAGLTSPLWHEQGTTKALRTVAIGVGELEGGGHVQAFLTERLAIRVALALGMAVGIEGDSGNAAAMGHGLVHVPGVEGPISGDVGGIKAQSSHGTD